MSVDVTCMARGWSKGVPISAVSDVEVFDITAVVC